MASEREHRALHEMASEKITTREGRDQSEGMATDLARMVDLMAEIPRAMSSEAGKEMANGVVDEVLPFLRAIKALMVGAIEDFDARHPDARALRRPCPECHAAFGVVCRKLTCPALKIRDEVAAAELRDMTTNGGI